MARGRIFTTLPTGAIGDDRLHALDLRALAVIALHDGMSTVRGTGSGCFAKYSTLASQLGVDIARFSKSLRRLKDFGYVVIEQQGEDRRRKTVRVLYAENSCTEEQQSPAREAAEMVAMGDNYPAEKVATDDNYRSEIVDTGDNKTGEIVDICDSETRRNLPKTTPHYIPLRGEIDSAEAGEINSVETAHLGDAMCDQEEVSRLVQSAVSRLGKAANEARLPSSGIHLRDLLPKNFGTLPNLQARLSKIEAALEAIGFNDHRLVIEDSDVMRNWLERVANDPSYKDEKAAGRAQRLLERLWEQDELLGEEVAA